ncbi:MAG: SIR2 family protein, partial [Syntrophobacteraceae bacterium]|nr:SIR2 family protein [Syntrophobacteraceae bacterium]
MHLRFFVSSPGDVADERTFAQQVIEDELPKDLFLRGQITCEAMRWDDPNAPVSMPATLTP